MHIHDPGKIAKAQGKLDTFSTPRSVVGVRFELLESYGRLIYDSRCGSGVFPAY
jgi:type I restriction-modification system DNA methylase subunit